MALLSRELAGWIDRLGEVWVTGTVTNLAVRGGYYVYWDLRDDEADVSVSVACPRDVATAAGEALADGARILIRGKVSVYQARTRLSLRALEVTAVGVGDLLAQIEAVRRRLAADGLLDVERKRPLPRIPGMVGLICGRNSDAEHDVVVNARRRWPAVRFRIEQVAVQGAGAVREVTSALSRLEQDPNVDVIVVTRGGGSLEDLLPFSDETLCRAVAACRVPVVVAIGHEQDAPLVDLVADVRASTPTDAARRVVPDYQAELDAVATASQRLRTALERRVDQAAMELDRLTRRPAFADRAGVLARHRDALDTLHHRVRRATRSHVDVARLSLAGDRARLAALGPQAVLQRGYAVLQRADGSVVTTPDGLAGNETLLATVAGGKFTVHTQTGGD